MTSKAFLRAARAHDIANDLDIPFGAAWKISTCQHKRQYRSEEEALEFAARWDPPQKAYRCDVCGRWHLTSGGFDEEG